MNQNNNPYQAISKAHGKIPWAGSWLDSGDCNCLIFIVFIKMA
jgi:hypothetical protein